jgi:hypothetical protein
LDGHVERRRNIKIPWPHDRCIACLRSQGLTEEHVIPRALGGRLAVDFLCAGCNSSIGGRIDSLVRRDPAIALSLHQFAAVHPDRGHLLVDGLPVLAHSEGGTSRAQLRGGEVRVRSEQLPDGSLIQPTDVARRSIQRILLRAGSAPGPLAEALQRFDSAPPDERTELAPGLEIVKWSVTCVQPDLAGPPLSPVLPLKIAFEFLACHLGGAIYDAAPPCEAIRTSLRTGNLHQSIIVECLRAERSESLHGIVFEGNHPYARVQIRLLGRIAYRVHFKNLAIGGSRFVYTHMLATNQEAVAEAK